ncbi:MAG: hypothetical protein WB767_00755 [Nocardioides sp.]
MAKRPAVSMDVKTVRLVLARVVWALCALFALALALAVLLIALDANPRNDLVKFVIDVADGVDLGFFDLTNPVKDFNESVENPAEDVRTALFNYGIAAVLWLVVGRVGERLIRP